MPSKLNSKVVGAKSQLKVTGSTNAASSHQPSEMNVQEQKKTNQSSSATLPVAAAGELSKEAGVNKKKQKRRMKEAAKRAAEQPDLVGLDQLQEYAKLANTTYQEMMKQMAALKGQTDGNAYEYQRSEYDDQYEPDDGEFYMSEATQQQYVARYGPSLPIHTNGHLEYSDDVREASESKSKKKKKKQEGPLNGHGPHLRPPPSFQRVPPPPPPSHHTYPATASHQPSKDRIWNTSTAQERENIKEFWLSLGEEERRSLVKVEKEAVLKKMKEQQKHSCSCTVCGRKRTAIEEELEVLYDAYYEELEQYANHQQLDEDGTPIIPPPRIYRPMSRQPPNRYPQTYQQQPTRGRIEEVGHADDAGDEDEEDSELDADDDVSEDEIEPELQGQPTAAATDFFNFGNSLTVQGGILTVADDLLKNDGKKFIEMMEQLAERRMQREEDAQYAAQGMSMQHGHPGPVEDDLYDEEDEEDDYDSQEEDEFEDDEMETMTEEQRMEEGRRMFQIFAARMFEQRVLTAYREKVAADRQRQLLEELEDEGRLDKEREIKRAKEAQKKKEKKKQQKQAKDEEKAKRDAEKAAEEAAAKEMEAKKAEELRQRKEEQRKKREAEKKALEEEKQRKEAEKHRRQQEIRDREAEQERKQREKKEKELKKKEDVKKKEREEREAKEIQAQMKKEREEREAKEIQAQMKKDREALERAEREVKPEAQAEIKALKKQNASTAQALPKKSSPANAASTGQIPSGLLPPHANSTHASPHLAIATPILPKASLPMRARQASFQGSRATSPKASKTRSTSSATSPSMPSNLFDSHSSDRGSMTNQTALSQDHQAQYQRSPTEISPGSVIRPPGFPNALPNSGPGFAVNHGPSTNELLRNAAVYPAATASRGDMQSNYQPSHGTPFPPAMNDSSPFALGHGSMDPPLMHPIPTSRPGPGNNADPAMYPHTAPRDIMGSRTHSRNTSTSSNIASNTQPIARPAPIQRPSSTKPDRQSRSGTPTGREIDDIASHLGSKALLDDDDEPLAPSLDEPRRGSMAIGSSRSVGPRFNGAPGFPEPIGTNAASRGISSNNAWVPQQSPFGSSVHANSPSWSSGFGRQNSNAFGSIGSIHQQQSTVRALTLRQILVSSCHKLAARMPMAPIHVWHRAEEIHREVQAVAPQQFTPISLGEIIDLCNTVGNGQNGGGYFEVLNDQGATLIRYHHGRSPSLGAPPGDIGSPIVSGGLPFGRSFQQPGSFLPSNGF